MKCDRPRGLREAHPVLRHKRGDVQHVGPEVFDGERGQVTLRLVVELVVEDQMVEDDGAAAVERPLPGKVGLARRVASQFKVTCSIRYFL